MRRRIVLVSIGALVPTLLLALGWLIASLRAHELSMQEQRTRLERSIDTVQATVDESLEELRVREDARPFYLYNRYYSPPDVLAVSDPVAISPLAGAPDDERVAGYFQLEPGGVLRTPYSSGERGEAGSEHERRINTLVRPDGYSLADARLNGPPTVEADTDRQEADGSEGARADAAPTMAGARQAAPTTVSDDFLRPTEPADQGVASVTGGMRGSGQPEGPLTTNYRTWGNEVAEDLRQARQGVESAEQRVYGRGRSAPQITRYDVTPSRARREEVPAEIQAPGRAQRPAASRGVSQASVDPLGMPSRVLSDNNRFAPEDLRDPLANIAEAIDYELMSWAIRGDYIGLQRTVTHEGVAVVQGVVLDRRFVTEAWLPALVERHADLDIVPHVISSGADARCSVRGALSEVLPLELCFPSAALDRHTASFQRELIIQLAILGGLLCIVLLALVAVFRASSRATELARHQSTFVSAVSHELRTPLTTIRMHAEMLEGGLVAEARRGQVYEELVAESVRLARLVENVLEASRLEEGQRRLRLTTADLAAHVRAVAEGQRSFLSKAGFDLMIETPDEPIDASFDVQAMDQIVVNLLDNAAKYGAEGKQEPLLVRVQKAGDRVLVSVLDRGPGIPEALRETVFERFYRVERAETAHTPGTGIGLSLVRDLARAQGGNAAALERDGGGTEIRVTVPTTSP